MTVSSVDATLNAVLRIGVQAGIVLSTKALTILDIDVASYSAGVETVVFADVANLTLSVVDADDAPSNVVECAAGQSADLVAEETFGFDIGAEVGASLQVADLFSWGVEPSKMLPVYYTSQEQCVERTSLVQTASSTTAAATATTATVDVGRQAAPTSDATTVLTTTFFYSAKACRSLGLINCPASLQTTTVTTATSTTTLTIPRGSSSGQVTWPAPTATTPLTKLATFGSNAKTIGLTASGTPSSFVPPGSHGHLTSKQEHIALGVGLGVGVPVLLSAIAAIMYVGLCLCQQRSVSLHFANSLEVGLCDKRIGRLKSRYASRFWKNRSIPTCTAKQREQTKRRSTKTRKLGMGKEKKRGKQPNFL